MEEWEHFGESDDYWHELESYDKPQPAQSPWGNLNLLIVWVAFCLGFLWLLFAGLDFAYHQVWIGSEFLVFGLMWACLSMIDFYWAEWQGSRGKR